MYKDEMIQLHQFLVYILKYLAENDQIKNDCSEYISLKISPHHIHKTKAEHKHAIFVLCKIIAQVIKWLKYYPIFFFFINSNIFNTITYHKY